MPEKRITFEIKEHLGIIGKSGSGWNKELNIVAWNGNDPKYDIRDWDDHHEKMSKGVTLSQWEMQKVTDLYLKNNTDKAVARGRAIEEERKARAEQARARREQPQNQMWASAAAAEGAAMADAAVTGSSIPVAEVHHEEPSYMSLEGALSEGRTPAACDAAECTAAEEPQEDRIQVAEDTSVGFDSGEGIPF